MRVLAMLLVLVLLLVAGGQPAGSPRTAGTRVALADIPDPIPVAAPVSPDPRVGAIFLGGGDLHTCTGSVVHSTSGDLILTAAHCFTKYFSATFVPGFANAADPSNVWTVDAVYLDPLWVWFRQPRFDYAFARVSRPSGGSIEAQVGSGLVLGMAPPSGASVSLVGYPAGTGGTPIGCQGSTGTTLTGFPLLWCKGLVDGTSGSPWIVGSTVTGVTGGLRRGGCTQYLSYSAPFDAHTAALLARAEAGGRGEAAPLAFLGC